jgi:hypothetical protein
MHMAVPQSQTRGPDAGPGGRGRAARVLGVVVEPQTWLSVAYLVTSFPIGVAVFVALTTLLALGLGLAITFIGIPLLVAVMYGWCAVADWDRALVNALLRRRIPRLPFGDEPGGRPWNISRIAARLGNPYTWRSLLYLLLRFPHGIATFVAATVFIAVPLQALALPLYYRYTDTQIGPNFTVDTLPEALMFAAAAPFAFIAGLHLLRALAWASGAATAALLGEHRATAPDEPSATGAREVLTWRGLRVTGHLEPRAAHVQSAQLTAFRWHAVVMGALMLLMAVINIGTQGGPWSLWPIWGLSIPLAVHAGYLARGWFGAHAGLYLVIMLGLFVIDLRYTDSYWFFWPLIGWGVGVGITGVLSTVLRRRTAEPGAVMVEDLALNAPTGRPASERPIEIDVGMRRVTVDGREVELTPKEFDVLVLLHENPGRPFSRGELLDRVWRNEYEVTERSVDACIVRLRRKLGGRAEAIQTVWGVGYRFQPGGAGDS